MSQTDPTTPSAAPEPLTPLAGEGDGPASDRLRRSPARAHDPQLRADLREPLTAGVVELRKRGQVATGRRPGPAGGAESHLVTMARRAAERAGRPRA
ncbi:hypothetical protein ACFWCB_09040 [Streptomyces sp. NPDC060048]|uniref:hypothetical protein n=1 Tax=unclassified Streptomyces TaxID=2593676 RepID=UPI0036A7A272